MCAHLPSACTVLEHVLQKGGNKVLVCIIQQYLKEEEMVEKLNLLISVKISIPENLL